MLTAESILKLERDSIEKFVLSCRDLYHGRVLDYGCGQQPYRQIVLDHIDDVGEYLAYDRADFPSNVSGRDVGGDPFEERHSFDVVLCNQVIQYARDPLELLRDIRYLLRPAGAMVMTGPTNWRVIEPADLFRFTVAGISELAGAAGYEVERVEPRSSISLAPGFDLPLGWGIVARA